MSTWNTLIRCYGAILRNGAYTYQDIASTFGPPIARQRQRLLEAKGRVSKSKTAENLRVALIYCKCEMTPPKSMSEFQQFKQDLLALKNYDWRGMTVREAWLNTLVGVEVALWFFLGECFGKFRIVGYKV